MNKSRNRQMILNLAASVVVFIVQFVINFWLSPFVISRLGEEAYGFITLANNFTQYAILFTVAINSMASRFISLEYNRGDYNKANKYFTSVFWMNVILSILIFITSFIIVVRLEHLINIEFSLIRDVKLTFALSFMNLIISCLATCFTATTFVTNRMDYHAFIQIGVNFIKMFATIGMFLLLAPHIYFVSFATLLSTIFLLVSYVVMCRRLLPTFSLNTKYFLVAYIVELAKSGFWILISNISSLLLNGIDLLLANIFISQVAMSRLSISKQLPTAIGGLLGFLSNIFAASFTTIVAANDKERLLKEIYFTIKLLGVCLTVPFAGVIIFGQDFFHLWLPQNIYNKFAIKQIYILMMLTLANVIVNAYMYSLHSLFIALNKVKIYSIMVFVSAIISIIFTVGLVNFTQLGVYAIAGTSTVVLAIVNLFLVPRYAESVLRLKPFTILRIIFKNYIALFITCIFYFLVKQILSLESWIEFTVTVAIIGFTGYFLDFFILLNKDEKEKLRNVVKRKFSKEESV